MIQGAGSNVGKSMLVAGIARAFTNRGLTVRPFKPQNMSNNAAVTVDGGEIGRAQALQALACRADAITDMNPVLLKPETDTGAQVILQGQRFATMKARDYGKAKAQLMPAVLESYKRLASQCDLVVIEGAGSPAEINLRAGDIANMGFAEAAGCPVILVGDIDRGGVIAQLVGTKSVLSQEDAARITGFAVNKFRGDPSLFDSGIAEIETRTAWPSLGVIPWFDAAWRLPAEDVMDIATRKGGAFKIAVPRLSRIANFDDLDPLVAEPNVTVDIIEAGRALPGDADLILIPGTKSTIADLAYFRAQGWDIDLTGHIRRGGGVLGICGGYQMLGEEIIDDEGIEGPPTRVRGLGHLSITTHMKSEKRLALTRATHVATGTEVVGYEIHIGKTTGADCAAPWLQVDGRPEGATRGKVQGGYLHGVFAEDAFRSAYLEQLGLPVEPTNYEGTVEATLEILAQHLETHMDLDRLWKLAKPVAL